MKRTLVCLLLLCALVPVAACGAPAAATSQSVTLILGAYSAPAPAYAALIPQFQAQWKRQHGQTVTFQQSYAGSGAQSRAIINGFQADVAALSLATDLDAIAEAGLITHDWTNTPTKGMVSDSVVAFAVRKGNPKGIHDWADLAQPGIQVLTPNPKTSGGAQWNILALYGAALRGEVRGVPQGDPAAAKRFLIAVLKNVKVMDKDAQTSITTFSQGVGDVAITYENLVLAAQQKGTGYDLMVPASTILVENPVAVVDAYAKRHGALAVAQAFVAFLSTPQAQRIFAQNGFRPLDPSGTATQASGESFQPVADLWTIAYLGGWKTAVPNIFGAGGVYTQAIAASQGQ